MSSIVPDDKDWTWTLDRACPDCGFDAAAVAPDDIARLVTAYTEPWAEVLARPDVATRPDPTTWSPLEYACHVRDVCDLFADRVRLMLDEDGAALRELGPGRDGGREPTTPRRTRAPSRPSSPWLPPASRGRMPACPVPRGSGAGVRSNGSEFTVLTLGRYGLHDLAHHLWDVRA